jgi:diguanylate cyclase (GGDEF)-like protein
LFNRRYLSNIMENEIKRCRRYRRTFTFILLDIDHFKTFNDTYGHLMGDRVLVKTAEILKENTRETDVVARYGGEEIAILLSEVDHEGAKIVAEKLRTRVAESSYSYKEKTVNVTISLGITQFDPERNDSITELIERADRALYQAKSDGRNCVRMQLPT